MKRKRFRTAEEEIEAIRREPAFRALVEDLKAQTPEQLERLEAWLDDQSGKEEHDGTDKEDS